MEIEDTSTTTGNEISGSPTDPIFLGASAMFHFHKYVVDAQPHGVFLALDFGNNKAITVGINSDADSQSMNFPYPNQQLGYNFTDADSYYVTQGFSMLPTSIQWNVEFFSINDSTHATDAELGVRMRIAKACLLTNGCLQYSTDKLLFEAYRKIGNKTVAFKSLYVTRAEWADGLPVTVHAGFGTSNTQPDNHVNIGVSDLKKYWWEMSNPLSCPASPCGFFTSYSTTTWGGSSDNIIPISAGSATKEQPLQIYQQSPFAGAFLFPPVNPSCPWSDWKICMGDVDGTPCEIPATPTPTPTSTVTPTGTPDPMQDLPLTCFDRPVGQTEKRNINGKDYWCAYSPFASFRRSKFIPWPTVLASSV
ncbi:MAG: hypothetical protein ABI604_20340, partial [Nitrospirota bacterium]